MLSTLRCQMQVLMVVLSVGVVVSSGNSTGENFLTAARRMQGGPVGPRGRKRCKAVAMKILQPPALSAYEECFVEKVRSDESHDWSIPGAEIKAQLDCWCQHNLTGTMDQFDCCYHDDIYPMCSVNCNPDCQSALAQECVQKCPAMCFEAGEYIVSKELCSDCNWVKCWPVLGCLLDHAEDRVESGDLARTCDEAAFAKAPELKKYWDCWNYAPKHSSHWNILSGIVHCICRESMDTVVNESHCCNSSLYGGGACNVECMSEVDCNSQAAQTCIHGCQLKCPALDMAPSNECLNDCLSQGSPCRRYVSCRPPATGNYICSDGRWPESSSGCCENNLTHIPSCPRLCENSRMWRLDRSKGKPWWTRWHPVEEMVVQCTCTGCPESLDAIASTLSQTVTDEELWANGQMMLIDIARREGLKYGPNRAMQEMMVRRNMEISELYKLEGKEAIEIDSRISHINRKYAGGITDAARKYGDQPPHRGGRSKREESTTRITIIVCTCLLLAFGFLMLFIMIWMKKRKANLITELSPNQEVVIGQPVAGEEPQLVTTGAPVTVSAPTKDASKAGQTPKWLS